MRNQKSTSSVSTDTSVAGVDMSNIYKIESSENPGAHNKASDARGLGQITPIVLKEWNNLNPRNTHTPDELFNEAVNSKISSWYMNERIPRLLRSKNIEDTTENRLIAYNWGIGRLDDFLKGKRTMPAETRNYLRKYKELAA